MIGCMTCPWAPTAGGTTAQSGPRNDGVTEQNMQQLHQRLGPAQSGQRNDGVTAQNMQQLHHRLGHINRTLHAEIEKRTTLEKTFNDLHKIKFYVFMGKKLNFVEKICI